jgi:hypothetical protein
MTQTKEPTAEAIGEELVKLDSERRKEAARSFDQALRERLSANRTSPRLKALMERSEAQEPEPKTEEED